LHRTAETVLGDQVQVPQGLVLPIDREQRWRGHQAEHALGELGAALRRDDRGDLAIAEGGHERGSRPDMAGDVPERESGDGGVSRGGGGEGFETPGESRDVETHTVRVTFVRWDEIPDDGGEAAAAQVGGNLPVRHRNAAAARDDDEPAWVSRRREVSLEYDPVGGDAQSFGLVRRHHCGTHRCKPLAMIGVRRCDPSFVGTGMERAAFSALGCEGMHGGPCLSGMVTA